MHIHPVLLCGGSGTRLWPLSRASYPKQFTKLTGDKSLFQAAALRLSGPDYAPPMVVTGSDFRFIVTEQLQGVAVDPGPILLEPEGRNTGPAILAAALHLLATDPGAVMLIAPSDHVVPDAAAFGDAVRSGLPLAQTGRVVTFGILPDRPETGYGYMEVADISDRPQPLLQFVEKPDAERAAAMLADGRYFWNAGIFLCRADTLVRAFDDHAPGLRPPVAAALHGAQVDLGFLRLAADPWRRADAVSIDHAVMERATNLSVVPFVGAWSDLGGWDAVWREAGPDASGVVVSDHATAIDCRNTLLRAEGGTQEIVGIGLDNLIAVAMPDAVLVATMDRAQDVRLAVEALKAQQVPQARTLPRDHRPWGWYESLIVGDRFQVKWIVVHPGAALSLQSHMHRSEHWIVVEGTARVTLDADVHLVTENQSVYIPLGARHRLENPGKVPMTLIEVQTGTYLHEDDIIRHEDRYARGQGDRDLRPVLPVPALVAI